jgi:hypothetical protein
MQEPLSQSVDKDEVDISMVCWSRGMSAGEIEREIRPKSRSAILARLKRIRENAIAVEMLERRRIDR